MAKKTLPLTDTKCRQAKHDPAGGNKLFDGDGLYLELMPSGSKKWRFKYRHAGKENRLSFGDYPEIGLAAVDALGIGGELSGEAVDVEL